MEKFSSLVKNIIKFVLPYGFYRLFLHAKERRVIPDEGINKLSKDAQIFWTKSQESNIHQDLSHWRGVGRFSEEKWLAIGEKHFHLYRELNKLIGKNLEKGIAILEWGGGGGANAWTFCKELEAKYYDVDISMPNLLEAEKQLAVLGKGTFNKIFLENPNDFSPIVNRNNKYDLVLSTAVFQHFPSEQYGIDVVKVIAQVLEENGLFIIQTRFYDNSVSLKSKNNNYDKNVISFTAYGVQAFREILEKENLMVRDMFFVDESNYCYYMGQKISRS